MEDQTSLDFMQRHGVHDTAQHLLKPFQILMKSEKFYQHEWNKMCMGYGNVKIILEENCEVCRSLNYAIWNGHIQFRH